MVLDANNMTHEVWGGSELGVLKGVQLATNDFINYGNLKSLDKSQGITSMSRLPPANDQDNGPRFALGRRDGSTCIFDSNTNQFSSPMRCGASPVIGVVTLADGVIVTCTEKGLLRQWKPNEGDITLYDAHHNAEKQVGSNIQTMVINK